MRRVAFLVLGIPLLAGCMVGTLEAPPDEGAIEGELIVTRAGPDQLTAAFVGDRRARVDVTLRDEHDLVTVRDAAGRTVAELAISMAEGAGGRFDAWAFGAGAQDVRGPEEWESFVVSSDTGRLVVAIAHQAEALLRNDDVDPAALQGLMLVMQLGTTLESLARGQSDPVADGFGEDGVGALSSCDAWYWYDVCSGLTTYEWVVNYGICVANGWSWFWWVDYCDACGTWNWSYC